MLNAVREWGNGTTWFAVAVAAVLFLYTLVYAYPHARHIAMLQQHEAIERENRAFCEKYGMPFGTAKHTLCAADLMDVRANEYRRTLDNLGII